MRGLICHAEHDTIFFPQIFFGEKKFAFYPSFLFYDISPFVAIVNVNTHHTNTKTPDFFATKRIVKIIISSRPVFLNLFLGGDILRAKKIWLHSIMF